MKRLLLVLLVLVFTVPAGAEVLIYKMTTKQVSFMEDPSGWELEKENVKGYLVLEGGPGDDTVDLWSIGLWKDKDPNGKMQKYAGAEHAGKYEIIEAEIGNKTLWIITGGDEDQKVLLTGQMTEAKLGDEVQHFAKKLTGIVISDTEDNPGERDIGNTKVTLALQTKESIEALAEDYDGDEAVDFLLNELEGKGYLID